MSIVTIQSERMRRLSPNFRTSRVPFCNKKLSCRRETARQLL